MRTEPAAGWGASRGRLARATLLCAVAMLAAPPQSQAQSGTSSIPVVVQKVSAADQRPEAAVRQLGGRLVRPLEIIEGFAAQIPARNLASLRRAPGVRTVSHDRIVRPMHSNNGFDASTDAGSMYNTAKIIKADEMWRLGITGDGVDVALIDSGVVPVNGLRTPGKVVNGPDLSFESQAPNLRYLDTYGHGTHMAGIIAGRSDLATITRDYTNHEYFVGVAPDARVVNIKVAESSGATDVSQVIAAIDWVVQHRTSGGLNIRVLNLSYGTDATQPYFDDPLAHAAEVAWRKGIVVVTAAGNGGAARPMNNPATDPYLISVGADDPNGTPGVNDDSIPSWSSRGDLLRGPSLVAPGRSIVSLRDPGSTIDTLYPGGRAGARFFRGSGTSQAAAVVSGAAALLLQHRPDLTPDQVKDVLTSSAVPIPGESVSAQGAGLLDVRAASMRSTLPTTKQTHRLSTGLGDLERARGSAHLAMNGVELRGEQDIFGATWDATMTSTGAVRETSWSEGTWNGNVWSGSGWGGDSWTNQTWEAAAWSGNAWSGTPWSSLSWSSATWSGSSWSSVTWSGVTWSSVTWSGVTWSSVTWSSASWE